MCCTYRSPNASGDYNESIRRTLPPIVNSHVDQVLICGDYNFKQINLEYHYVDGGIESEQSKLYDGSQDAFLHQHVREFTRAR